MNCPFYGRHFVEGRFVPGSGPALPMALLNSEGNQCALVTTSFTPCYLEIEGKPVDWRSCKRVAMIRIG